MKRLLSIMLMVIMLIGVAAADNSQEQSFVVGSVYVFGSYEQDNNHDNGTEPIEWIVLQTDGTKTLLISKHILDCQPFAASKENVTWENSSIRAWLNGDFLAAAFSPAEQAAIVLTESANTAEHGNAEWPAIEWSNTQDRIFLMSYHDGTVFYPEKNDRRAAPTEYAKAQGASVFMSGHADYWTRSWGKETYDACKVNIYGDFSTYEVTAKQGVRPMLWLDTSVPADQFRTALYADACTLRDAGLYSEAVEAFAALGNYSDSVAQANACRESDEHILHVGFHYTFGRYEQDNNTENGAEPIEWLVLANDGEKAMLISRHVLDCQPFAATTEGVTWETSGIRAWLNSDFVMAAFTAAEQEALLPMSIVNTAEHQNPAWPVVDWVNTTDTVILLSYQEATSLMTKDSRRGVPTAYAKKQGASVFMSEHADQWLRSAGKETFDACSVNIYGDIATRKVTDKLGVRPVIWLDLSYASEGFAKDQYAIACSMQASGQYLEAASIFDSIGNFQDSVLRAQQCRYEQACAEEAAGDYDAAIVLFDMLGSYSDSYTREGDCRYALGKQQMERGDYATAMTTFAELGNYRDCMQLLTQCMDQLGIQRRYMTTTTVNAGHDNGYSQSKTISGDDIHFGWNLGRFFMSGFTRVTEDDEQPVFIKTLGDTVTLYFELQQDITQLDGNTALYISDDFNGYDEYFGVKKTDFGRGTLIVRYTNYQNAQVTTLPYTDYLAATDTYGADTRIVFYEEGDYEIALNYEVMSDGVIDHYSDYRVFFRFSIRNGNCMVYPFDAVTGAELSNSSVAPNGFYLDLARSRYLDINVKRTILTEGSSGLTEDARFNRPAKDGDRYTQEGIYTITVSNRYTGETTTKTIFVGSEELLEQYKQNGFTLP